MSYLNNWLYYSFITARKQSLGQGNIFTNVCHSVHRWGRACLGAFVLGGMCRGCTQGKRAWWGVGGAWQERWPLQPAVRILLVCILLGNIFENTWRYNPTSRRTITCQIIKLVHSCLVSPVYCNILQFYRKYIHKLTSKSFYFYLLNHDYVCFFCAGSELFFTNS